MRSPPERARPLEKGDALVLAVRGFHDVGERMRRPGVPGIAIESRTGEFLGAAEFAGLLEPEGVEAEEETGEGIVAIPGRQDPRGAIAIACGPAHNKTRLLRPPYCYTL